MVKEVFCKPTSQWYVHAQSYGPYISSILLMEYFAFANLFLEQRKSEFGIKSKLFMQASKLNWGSLADAYM